MRTILLFPATEVFIVRVEISAVAPKYFFDTFGTVGIALIDRGRMQPTKPVDSFVSTKSASALWIYGRK
jgi:hypothetical protein